MIRGFSRKIGLAALSFLLLLGSYMSFPVTSTYAAVDGKYIYEDIDADTVRLTGYTELSESHLVVPATLAGKRVVEIKNQSFWVPAFSGNKLTIEEGVLRIGHQAFYKNSLTDLIIPSTVIDIGEGAFWDNQLTSITLPEHLTKISDSSFGGNNLTSVTIPNSVTEIEYRAFQSNRLTQVIIPSNVNKIWSGAFYDNNLHSVLVLNGDVEYSLKFGDESHGQFANNPSGLTLYGYEGSTTEAYAVDKGHRFEVITAALADLAVDIPGLTFDSGDYAYDLATNSNSISVTALSMNPFAEVKINGTAVDSGTSSVPISLNQGANTIIVDVTIPDGTTKAQYVLNILVDSTTPSIDLTADPTSSTNGDVTVTVDANASSGISVVKWAAGNQGTVFFTTDGEAVVGNGFTVTANGTYTVYARDNAGNEAVETITISNIDRSSPTIDLTASPTSLTNGNVTVTVATYANSGISELKWAAGNEGTSFFTTDGEAVVGHEFTVTANGTYTVYARDNAGNEAVETIAISNIDRNLPTIDLTASPTISTNGNVTVIVAVYAASGISESKWAAGNEGTAFFAAGGEAVVGNQFTVTANGTYTVYARDNAGNEAVEVITISNNVRSTSSVDPAPPNSPEDSDPRTVIVIGPGVIIIKVAPRDIKELPKDNGGKKEVVTLPNDVWDEIPKLLDKDGRPVIRVIINEHQSDVELYLPGNRLAEVWDVNPNVEFDMQLNGSSFQLKVSVLDLEQLAARLGIAVDEMNVIIKISALTGETKEDFIQAAEKQGMTLLSEVIEFQLIVSGGDKWVEITDFGGTYMTKSIVLDEQFANRNYMAVLFDPDGRTFTYVPATMASRSNGQQDSVIQMPHNSIYAVVETDLLEFADMQGHWAEPEVEHLGSKRIVKGITLNDFAPNRNITRAEFASLLVRALGIKTDLIGAGDVFKDVASTSWYSTEVEAAFKAGLVRGISSTHFAPEAQITREQIAVMLMNAHALVNDESNYTEQIPHSLTPFTDSSEVSAWARDAMSQAVASELIQGMSTDRLAPDAPATRAQAAVMLHRLMIMIEFLD